LVFFLLYSGLRQKCDVIVTQVTKYNESMKHVTCVVTYVTVTVTQSYNIKKVIESSGTNDIIQYSNNMLALWQAYVL